MLRRLAKLASADARRRYLKRRLWPLVERIYGDLGYVGITDGQHAVLTGAHDEVITPVLLTDGHYQRDAVAQAAELVAHLGFPMGGWFVDVGANIGTSTMYALSGGKFSRALCCEPAPGNFRLLRANIALNDLEERCVTVKAAIADKEGSVHMALSTINCGDHRVFFDGGASDEMRHRPQVLVRATTLDTALDEHGIAAADVSLLWIDTQGYEGFVLAGARRLLTRPIPVVAELWPAGQKMSGGAELFFAEARSRFATFVDLAASSSERAIDELTHFAERFHGREGFADVLLLPRRPHPPV